MSDPFEALRGVEPEGLEPDLAAIRARARRIRARRYAVASSAAGLFVALAVGAATLVVRGPERRPRVAARAPTAPPTAAREAYGAGGEALTALMAGSSPTPAGSPPPRAAAGRAAVTQGARPGPGPAQGPVEDAGALELTLQLSRQTVGPGEEVAMLLVVCNRATREVRLAFRDAQRQDFEVLRGGAVVWRWGATQAFAQEVGEERWAPGACRDFGEVRWRGVDSAGRPVGPGRYEVVGVLTAQTPKRSAPQQLCVVTCV